MVEDSTGIPAWVPMAHLAPVPEDEMPQGFPRGTGRATTVQPKAAGAPQKIGTDQTRTSRAGLKGAGRDEWTIRNSPVKTRRGETPKRGLQAARGAANSAAAREGEASVDSDRGECWPARSSPRRGNSPQTL